MTQAEQYCDHLLSTGRKPSTVGTYRSSLNICIDLLGKAGMHTQAEEIGEAEIYYLVGHLDMSEATARSYLMVLNGMLEYYTGKALVKKMRILWNRPNRHRIFITTEDLAKMYAVADPKEKVILVLGAFMGLRRDEMQHIKLEDIRRDRILIHGKGHGKNGLVFEQPMPVEVREVIDQYIRWRNRLPGTDRTDGRLIIYRDERRNELRHYADRCGSISQIVSDLGKKVGVEATCHSLRRLFCTSLYYGVNGSGGCDLATLKDLMRHASVNTTLTCYIDVKDREKETAISAHAHNLGVIINI